MAHGPKKQSTGSFSSGSAKHNRHTAAMGHGGGKKFRCVVCGGKKGWYNKDYYTKSRVWVVCGECGGTGWMR